MLTVCSGAGEITSTFLGENLRPRGPLDWLRTHKGFLLLTVWGVPAAGVGGQAS